MQPFRTVVIPSPFPLSRSMEAGIEVSDFMRTFSSGALDWTHHTSDRFAADALAAGAPSVIAS
jgi:hypothetical protein